MGAVRRGHQLWGPQRQGGTQGPLGWRWAVMQGPPLGNGCGQDVGWRWRVVQQAQVLDVGPGVPAPPRAAPARGRLRADICVVIPPERGRGLRPPPAHGPLAMHCGSIVPGDARGLCRSVAVLGRCCSGPKGASPSCRALTRMSSHPSPSLTCLCLSVCPSFPSLSLSASPTPLLCQGGTEAWRCHQVRGAGAAPTRRLSPEPAPARRAAVGQGTCGAGGWGPVPPGHSGARAPVLEFLRAGGWMEGLEQGLLEAAWGGDACPVPCGFTPGSGSAFRCSGPPEPCCPRR